MVRLGLNFGFVIVNFMNSQLILKYQKYHRSKVSRRFYKKINFLNIIKPGIFLRILSFGFFSFKQKNSVTLTLKRHIKKLGKLIFHGYPNSVLSFKPKGSRMGKGKGNRDKTYVFKVKPGFTLVNISSLNNTKAIYGLKVAKKRLNVKSVIYSYNF